MAVDPSFTIVTQEPTVEYIGGTNTQDVIAVGFVTTAHQVYGEVRVPQASYSAALAKAAAAGYADIFETIFSFPNVSDLAWGQRTTRAGLLVDQVTIYVSSDSGQSTAPLGPIDLVNLGPGLHSPEIAALAAQLTSAETQSAGA